MADLESVARALVSPGRGILAADESHPTIAKRFAALGIENTVVVAADRPQAERAVRVLAREHALDRIAHPLVELGIERRALSLDASWLT